MKFFKDFSKLNNTQKIPLPEEIEEKIEEMPPPQAAPPEPSLLSMEQ